MFVGLMVGPTSPSKIRIDLVSRVGFSVVSKSSETPFAYADLTHSKRASRRPKQISVLSEAGEREVLGEWLGGAPVLGF